MASSMTPSGKQFGLDAINVWIVLCFHLQTATFLETVDFVSTNHTGHGPKNQRRAPPDLTMKCMLRLSMHADPFEEVHDRLLDLLLCEALSNLWTIQRIGC